MLHAFGYLLCYKLCWHNWPGPSFYSRIGINYFQHFSFLPVFSWTHACLLIVMVSVDILDWCHIEYNAYKTICILFIVDLNSLLQLPAIRNDLTKRPGLKNKNRHLFSRILKHPNNQDWCSFRGGFYLRKLFVW